MTRFLLSSFKWPKIKRSLRSTISVVLLMYLLVQHRWVQRRRRNCIRSTLRGRFVKAMVKRKSVQTLYLVLTRTGLTETSTVVSSTAEFDIWYGSSGSIISGVKAKIMSADGVELTEYNQPGELVVQSHSVVLGYLNNDKANEETFLDDTDGGGRWMRTGDEAVIRKAPSGHEHLFIVDRIKELIKVKVCCNIFLTSSEANSSAGSPSSARRARSSSPQPSLSSRLRRDPRA